MCTGPARRFMLARCGIFFSGLSAQVLKTRMCNGTRALPPKPLVYDYQVVNAFPGLDFYRPLVLVTPPGGPTNSLCSSSRAPLS